MTRLESGDYIVPNVLSPRDLVSRPYNMDETVLHTSGLDLVGWSPSINNTSQDLFLLLFKVLPLHVHFVV